MKLVNVGNFRAVSLGLLGSVPFKLGDTLTPWHICIRNLFIKWVFKRGCLNFLSYSNHWRFCLIGKLQIFYAGISPMISLYYL